jgi:uncharacterized protein (TIGR02147 family)
MSAKPPFSIFQYSSHLEFLQDAYDSTHAQDESFSYDKIATLCGLKSRTEARNVIKGLKKPTEPQLLQLASCLGLNDPDEKKYLLCLFRFHEAGGSAASYEIFQKLIALQSAKLPAQNPFREIEIATSVLHMTILSVFELPNMAQDLAFLAALLKDRYSREEIGAAIQDLEIHHFIQRDAATAKWVLCQKHIKKYDYNSNFFLKRFHTQSLKLAQDALENEAPSERYLVGASLCINSKVFPRIVQKMNAFVENLMQLEGVAGSPDTVIQFNQQLIKVTTPGHANNERGLGHEVTERGLDPLENTVIA